MIYLRPDCLIAQEESNTRNPANNSTSKRPPNKLWSRSPLRKDPRDYFQQPLNFEAQWSLGIPATKRPKIQSTHSRGTISLSFQPTRC